jgi:putative flippase GtrA
MLLTRNPSVLGQGVRFALAGGTVAAVYIGTTTILAEITGLPFQAALAVGFCVAMIVHFTLQRTFVWIQDEEFALPMHRQAARYLVLAGAQYGATAASTAVLPRALDVSPEIVYLATVAVVLCINFLVFRHGIFHPEEHSDPLIARIAEHD